MACIDRIQLTRLVAAAIGIAAAACSSRTAPPASGHEAAPVVRAGARGDDAGPPAVAIDATIDAPAPAVAPSGAPGFERAGTLAAELRTAARSVVLVEEAGGLVARDAGGAAVRTLVAGAVSRGSYDARIGVLWFLRGGRLEAIDLGAPAGPPIPWSGTCLTSASTPDPAWPSTGPRAMRASRSRARRGRPYGS